tara:strand:- start:60 stop:347 length:288 start_codon:yes stop_codon:yes gene_type:complete
MGYIKFYDAALGADQVINLDKLAFVEALTNECNIQYQLLASDDSVIYLNITSTGNGVAIRNKVIDAISRVDGGGITTIDMSDTATTAVTQLLGIA